MTTTPPAAPTIDYPLAPEDRALFDALLDPSRSLDTLDPFALAALFESDHVRAALDARRQVRAARREARLAALTERAIDHLSRLLDTADDPAELRRAINSAIKLAAGASPRSPDAPARPPAPADPDDDIPDARPAPRVRWSSPDVTPTALTDPHLHGPDPYSPDTPPNTAEELPGPHYLAAPQDVARAQVRTLRFAPARSDIYRLLHWSLALPIRLFDLQRHRFVEALASSPAWIHRARRYTIDDHIVTTEHTATVRVTYHDDGGDHRALFHLARADQTNPPDAAGVWVTCAIIPEPAAPGGTGVPPVSTPPAPT
jgi:hypothetical protein